jgi:hypothetical protein
MAQTKRRSTAPRAGSTKKRSSSTRSRSSSKQTSAGTSRNRGSRSTGNGSGSNGVEVVREAVEDKAKSAGQTVGRAAGKAKIPLIAGGAALAGAAGGLALASRHGRRVGVGSALRMPRVKVDSGDVAKVAKEVGNFSAQVGALATELQRNREAAGGNGERRSPIEVALHGLTSRR